MNWLQANREHGYANYGIVPSTGVTGLDWPASGAIPASFSAGGWTYGNEGFVQQTFLGASIRSFSVNGGFGDTSSTLSVSVVNDEYNASDKIGFGGGDDPYHNGRNDNFSPPPVGSPVFFKFGKCHATVEQAWRKTFDVTYSTPLLKYDTLGPEPAALNSTTLPPLTQVPFQGAYFAGSDNPINPITGAGDLNPAPTGTSVTNKWVDLSPYFDTSYIGKGRHHFPFGGILQSYTENRGTGGSPLYELQVVDPREILTNATMILNNYAGTTFNNQNLLNIYGFLEYDPTQDTLDDLEGTYPETNILTKEVNENGSIIYSGDDMRRKKGGAFSFDPTMPPPAFPVTGRGYSRRTSNGIPLYRVLQAMDALFGYTGKLNKEYAERGFGGAINFRGFNYVVDFSGLPLDKIPKSYYLEFDQLDLMSFAQELCDIISHDLAVSLLPIINHPSIPWLYSWNQHCIANNNVGSMIAGIIRIDAINRSIQPQFGSIVNYMNTLAARGVEIENRDVGFELSNVETDKFIVGAQETELYAFTNNKDRDFLEVRKHKEGIDNKVDALLKDQWYLSTSLNQQMLPFYGFLDKTAVTIPRGFGSYQQILLDATSLNAHGVGNYYVATEMELRAASVSYERWAEFVNSYNNFYMQSIEKWDALEEGLLQSTPAADLPDGQKFQPNISNNYAVTVPRCVFRSDKNFMAEDGLPASPCSPPYGYPLYYKRAEKIGIPEAGATHVIGSTSRLITNLAKLKLPKTRKKYMKVNMEGVEEATQGIGNWVEKAGKSLFGAAAQLLTTQGRSIQDDKVRARIENYGNKISKTIGGKVAEGIAAGVAARMKAKYDLQVGVVEDVLDRNMDLVKYASRMDGGLGADVIENAMKVYGFVKAVADKHLGKTFLVKIPQRANLKWKKQIIMQQSNAGLSGVADGGSALPTGISPQESGELQSQNELLAQARENRLAEVKYGPFAFRPMPVNPELGYESSRKFQRQVRRLRRGENRIIDNGITKLQQSYLSSNTTKHKFTHGALKCHYNPLIDDYEYNYTPEPQGGFHPFELYQNHIVPSELSGVQRDALHLGTKQLLMPYDMTNFINDGGRVGAYVRYDNSQFLNFNSVGKDSMTQESAKNGIMVPDLIGEMDNMKEDKFHSFNTKEELTQSPKSVAFVKCEVDSKLYMAPATVGVDKVKTVKLLKKHTMWKTKDKRTGKKRRAKGAKFEDAVFGRDVIDIGQYSKPKQLWNASGCYWEDSYIYYKSEFVPNPSGGGRDGTEVKQEDFLRVFNPTLGGDIIPTDIQSLDKDHVYAIITMPGRITPTIDSRMLDGPHNKFQAVTKKHLLTMDTVKIGPAGGFEKPTIQGQPTNFLVSGCDQFKIEDIINGLAAQKLKLQHLNIANPEKMVGVTNPSPVYPDLVVLPLMSSERCYGPWISSSLGGQATLYKGIGGKITFEKDEGLAPWNYAGYKLMDEAGKLKAQFSNSIMLFNERGGLVFPDAPRGNSLTKALVDGGPLVTSISVNVDGAGVKTTYKMDLYTSKFGKLAKQKEIMIGQIARERQKMRDERNSLMRKGMGKGQATRNFGEVYKQYDEIIAASQQSSDFLTSMEQAKTYNEMIVASTTSRTFAGHNAAGKPNSGKETGHEVTTQASKTLKQTLTLFDDEDTLREAHYNSAGGSFGSLFAPASRDVYHPNMPYFGYNHSAAKQARFYYEDHDEDRLIMNVGGTPGSLGGSSTGGGSRSTGQSSGDDIGDDDPGDGVPDPGAGVGGGAGTGDGAGTGGGEGDTGGGADDGAGTGGGTGY